MSEDSNTIWAHDEYHFHGQRANEHVMLVKNQHPVTLAPMFIIAAITLAVPVFCIKLLSGPALYYSLIAYVLLVGFYLGYHLYAYFNSMCILTSERILNVQQFGFFHRQISEAELDRIQDVSSDIKGMLATIFGFGNVTIRTASKESLLILNKIGDPYDVQQAIVRALKEDTKKEAKD